VLYDRSESIRQSVNDVEFFCYWRSLLVGGYFPFLRNVRATIFHAGLPRRSCLPRVMYLLDFSPGQLSLMALTLRWALWFDDAVVMLENIVREWSGEGRWKRP